MDLDRSNDLILKYQRFKSSGCKYIGIRNFEFMTKTQFLYQQKRGKINFFKWKEVGVKQENIMPWLNTDVFSIY